MAEKEYIEKSKLISNIECIDICDCTDIDDIFIEVERTIDEQPTADVQEVVRCKDCKKFCSYLSFYADNRIGEYGYCQITNMNVPLDFYCGNAEKNG